MKYCLIEFLVILYTDLKPNALGICLTLSFSCVRWSVSSMFSFHWYVDIFMPAKCVQTYLENVIRICCLQVGKYLFIYRYLKIVNWICFNLFSFIYHHKKHFVKYGIRAWNVWRVRKCTRQCEITEQQRVVPSFEMYCSWPFKEQPFEYFLWKGKILFSYIFRVNTV